MKMNNLYCDGGVLVSVLMISVVMSLFALTFAYVINEKINSINSFSNLNDVRVAWYKLLDDAEKNINDNSLKLAINHQVTKSYDAQGISGNYLISRAFSQNDNIDNYLGSAYQVFRLKLNVNKKDEDHGGLVSTSYYWSILSFYQLNNNTYQLTKEITPPVINYSNLSSLQKKSYQQLINWFKINQNQAILNLNLIKDYLPFDCFNAESTNTCQLSDGWLYEKSTFYYIVIINNHDYFSVFKVPYQALTDLSKYYLFTVNLKDQLGINKKIVSKGLFFNDDKPFILFQIINNDNHLLAFLKYSLEKNTIKIIDQLPKLKQLKKIFPISKKLDLMTTGFFASDIDNNLWFINYLTHEKKIIKMPIYNDLVNLSVIDIGQGSYWLFIFYDYQLDVFKLNESFDIDRKLVSKRLPFKVVDASARYGLVWFLTDFFRLKAYHWNSIDEKWLDIKAKACQFDSFSVLELKCDNTIVKINDIVRPYKREALKVALAFDQI